MGLVAKDPPRHLPGLRDRQHWPAPDTRRGKDCQKTHTLVTIIGLSDLLGSISQAAKDPAWLGFSGRDTGLPRWCSSGAASRCPAYGREIERRLARGQ